MKNLTRHEYFSFYVFHFFSSFQIIKKDGSSNFQNINGWARRHPIHLGRYSRSQFVLLARQRISQKVRDTGWFIDCIILLIYFTFQICSSDNQGDCHKFFVDATIADNIVATFWNAVTWIFMIFTFNENEIEYIKFKLPMNIGIALITSDFFDEFPQSMEEIWQYVGTDLITEYLRLKFIKEFMIFIISNGWMAGRLFRNVSI